MNEKENNNQSQVKLPEALTNKFELVGEAPNGEFIPSKVSSMGKISVNTLTEVQAKRLCSAGVKWLKPIGKTTEEDKQPKPELTESNSVAKGGKTSTGGK